MNKKKKIFIAVWVVVTAALFYYFKGNPSGATPEMADANEAQKEAPVRLKGVNSADELPAKLKARIDNVLARIEGMWDPTGRKVKEVGEKMESLEKALEENNPELAEKILSEIEIIVSEK